MCARHLQEGMDEEDEEERVAKLLGEPMFAAVRRSSVWTPSPALGWPTTSSTISHEALGLMNV